MRNGSFGIKRAIMKTTDSLVAVLYNMPVPAMIEPKDYGPAQMRSNCLEKYSRRADSINATRSASTLADVNVVVILSEAFSDPTRVRGVKFSLDPIEGDSQTLCGALSRVTCSLSCSAAGPRTWSSKR